LARWLTQHHGVKLTRLELTLLTLIMMPMMISGLLVAFA
jgi:hypothetical protein